MLAYTICDAGIYSALWIHRAWDLAYPWNGSKVSSVNGGITSLLK